MDISDVSPADFGHTRELIDWGYRSTRRYLGMGSGRPPLPEQPNKRLKLNPAKAA